MKFLKESIHPAVYRALGTRNAGEVVSRRRLLIRPDRSTRRARTFYPATGPALRVTNPDEAVGHCEDTFDENQLAPPLLGGPHFLRRL